MSRNPSSPQNSNHVPEPQAGSGSKKSPKNLDSNPDSAVNWPHDIRQGAEPLSGAWPPHQRCGAGREGACRAVLTTCSRYHRPQRGLRSQLRPPTSPCPHQGPPICALTPPQGGPSGGEGTRPGSGDSLAVSWPRLPAVPLSDLNFLIHTIRGSLPSSPFLRGLSRVHMRLVRTKACVTDPGFRIGSAHSPGHRIPQKTGSLLLELRHPSERPREDCLGHSSHIQSTRPARTACGFCTAASLSQAAAGRDVGQGSCTETICLGVCRKGSECFGWSMIPATLRPEGRQ